MEKKRLLAEVAAWIAVYYRYCATLRRGLSSPRVGNWASPCATEKKPVCVAKLEK
jgi:hypothetical protein